MGTRPEIIKMGPVYHALKQEGLDPMVLHTGQHDQMAWPLYDFFGIQPEAQIDLTRERPSLGHLGGRLMDGIDALLHEHDARAVLVHGDTTSALMGALAAFYARIPIGHVEAGLRSGDSMDPFPEEMNRTLITRMARWHFAPTHRSVENLLRDQVPGESIHRVGNTVVDAAQFALKKAAAQYELPDEVHGCPVAPFVRRAEEGRLLLVTLHRRENWGEPIVRVAATVRGLLELVPELHVVWPVHPNPVVRSSVVHELGALQPEMQSRVRLTEPLGYAQMLWVMRHAWLALTDSGGIQEEAAALSLPVLVARETTERPELIEAGGGALVGTDPSVIRAWVETLNTNEDAYRSMRGIENPYGDGTAASSIAGILARDLAAHRVETLAA